MRKESVNYNIEGSLVVKRSPSVSGRNNRKIAGRTDGTWVRRDSNTGELRRSMSRNIDSLGRLLKESEQVLPRPKS
jgi:hypothetical protein